MVRERKWNLKVGLSKFDPVQKQETLTLIVNQVYFQPIIET